MSMTDGPIVPCDTWKVVSLSPTVSLADGVLLLAGVVASMTVGPRSDGELPSSQLRCAGGPAGALEIPAPVRSTIEGCAARWRAELGRSPYPLVSWRRAAR